MAGSNESQLVAILLPAPAAADAIRRAWDHGAAVVMLDRTAPRLAELIAAAAPTVVVDADGARPYPGGRPVAAAVGAVVATSGTTGGPRFVELTTAGLNASADAVHAALGVDPDHDRWLACLPLHSVAGLAIVARAYATDTALEVHPRFDVQAVIEAAGTCSLVSLVPTTLARLLDTDADATARFRRILVGGAPIPSPLLDRAAADARIVTTYGLTETGGGCVHDGHPLAGAEIDLSPATAEIMVRGPMVMRGYRHGSGGHRESVDTETWHDGWLRTGDVGHWSADGRLRVVDRIKDLVISGGVSVSPIAVEAAYLAIAGIADLAVIGASDAEWGERVVACVVPTDPAQPPSLDALRAAGVAAGLRAAELPRELRIVDSIPRTPGGKPLRRALRDATNPGG